MENDPLKISGMHDGAKPEIFKNAEKLRANMTKSELLIWQFLKTKPLGVKFRRQHPINRYILDFYCHQKRLAIEIDGGYHLSSEQKEKNMQRTLYLNGVGIKEIRYTNEEVLNSLEIIKSKIESELHLPPPSPKGVPT